ncbi:MAG: hypothetical protein II943_04615 [Victivallales bacterium]|nr:hypothetical protein [Victivallales bacterium]
MKKFKTVLLATICIFAFCATPIFARGHRGHGGPGPRPGFHGGHRGYVPAPHYYHGGGHHHHHHHSGPSRGWYNSALIIDATLEGIALINDIVNPPTTTVVQETVYAQPPVVTQPVVVQQPVVQQPVVVQQPQPVYVTPTVVTPTPVVTAPVSVQPVQVQPVVIPASTPVVTPVRTQTYWR